MFNYTPITLSQVFPHIRYVNNYAPVWSYTEPIRILYDFEFMYVIDGECNILYDNVNYPLSKGDVFYFCPGIKNQMTVDANAGFHTHCIHFDWMPPANASNDFSVDGIYIEPAFNDLYFSQIEMLKKRPIFMPSDFSIPVHIKNTPVRLYELFNRCYYSFVKNDEISGIKLKADFLNILALLLSLSAGDLNPSAYSVHPLIKKATDYIHVNYHKPLSIAFLADYCGLSEKYFGKLFKDNIGLNFNSFLTSLRIENAKKLLMGSRLSIEEIAIKVGFENTYYFSSCFKKVTGYSPSFYKKLVT